MRADGRGSVTCIPRARARARRRKTVWTEDEGSLVRSFVRPSTQVCDAPDVPIDTRRIGTSRLAALFLAAGSNRFRPRRRKTRGDSPKSREDRSTRRRVLARPGFSTILRSRNGRAISRCRQLQHVNTFARCVISRRWRGVSRGPPARAFSEI